jgi:ubiquitin-conjugating enzyme E2 H
MSDWKVEMVEDSNCEFNVEFPGPAESPYMGGLWKVHGEDDWV